MTGGSRVAQGATLITTCRADNDNALQTMSNKRKTSKYDIEKYELCLTPVTKKRKIDPYALTVTRDFLSIDQTNDPAEGKGFVEVANMELSPTTGAILKHIGITYCDKTMSSYYRDIYDARTDLELFLAQKQISLHCAANKTDCILRRIAGFLNDKSCRRNAIIFVDTVGNLDTAARSDVAKDYMQLTNHPQVYVSTVDGMNVFVYEHNDSKNNFENEFMLFLEDVFSPNFNDTAHKTLFSMKKPSDVVTIAPNEQSTQGITPALYFFQGFSLGGAKMDARDGDNVFSCLRSGAMTVRNGPFQVVAGDQMMWIRHSELIAFDTDGNRKIRPLCNMSNLKALLFDPNGSQANILENSAAVLANLITTKTVPGKCDPTGNLNSSFHTFIAVPMRTVFSSVTGTGSILDSQRRLGSAISNAGGSAMVDILIGSDM